MTLEEIMTRANEAERVACPPGSRFGHIRLVSLVSDLLSEIERLEDRIESLESRSPA